MSRIDDIFKANAVPILQHWGGDDVSYKRRTGPWFTVRMRLEVDSSMRDQETGGERSLFAGRGNIAETSIDFQPAFGDQFEFEGRRFTISSPPRLLRGEWHFEFRSTDVHEHSDRKLRRERSS